MKTTTLAAAGVALAAMAELLARPCQPPPRRSSAPKGDKPEDHESNTFGLPDGTPIRRGLKRFVAEQMAHVLGELPAIGAELPAAFPPLSDYDDPMASAMTPLISAYWDAGGKMTRERLGLDPADWRVVDPNLHKAIADSTLKFCASTNATTTKHLDDALAELRAELQAGLVDEGETIPQLRKRVQSVFTGLHRERAEMIARTEASRAVHAASLRSAEESGVVAGKRWLASANSCERCLEMEARTKAAAVALAEPFAHGTGADPAYATIPNPPLHPHCRCTVTYELTEEYRRLVEGGGGSAPPAVEPLNPDGPRVRRGTRAVPRREVPERFGPSTAPVRTASETGRAAVEKALRRIFGRPVDVGRLASLAGAPDDASVFASVDGRKVEVRVDHPMYTSQRTLWRRRDGRVEIHNDFFFPRRDAATGTGLGTRVLGRQVEQAAAEGVALLSTLAGRSRDMNGYYTWPRLGYDGVIPARVRRKLPADLAGSELVSDLMATAAGRDWWKAEGVQMGMTFDLDDGSLDRRRHEAYVESKGHGRRSAPPIPDPSLPGFNRVPGFENPDLDPGDDELLDRIADEMGRKAR